MAVNLKVNQLNNLRILVVVFWLTPIILVIPLFHIFQELAPWSFDVLAREILPLYVSVLMIGLLILSITGDIFFHPLYSRWRSLIPKYHPTSELIDLLTRGTVLAVLIMLFFTSIIIIFRFKAILNLQWKMIDKLVPFFLVMGIGTILHLFSAVIRLYKKKPEADFSKKDKFSGWLEKGYRSIPLKLATTSLTVTALIAFVSPSLVLLIHGRNIFSISLLTYVIAVMTISFPIFVDDSSGIIPWI